MVARAERARVVYQNLIRTVLVLYRLQHKHNTSRITPGHLVVSEFFRSRISDFCSS